MNITILTVGSRGDIQPYIALGVGLKNAGYQVTVCTAKNYESFVRDNQLTYGFMDADFLEMLNMPEFRDGLNVGRSPLKLMRKINAMQKQIMTDAWHASQGADAIIYHPKAMAGYHIAEALGIPGFVSLPLPLLTPTRAFPSPILPPTLKLGGAFNRWSTGVLLGMISAPYHGLVNDWRVEQAGLPKRRRFASDMLRDGQPVPTLYCFSRHVVPVPDDWDEPVHVTGYWFLDQSVSWEPPASLVGFLNAGSAPVYVGFGSMTWNDGARAAQVVLDALARTGQRGVLARGWGGLKVNDLPDNVYMLDAAPHDWLFPRMAAVVHHGGAGTTAAGLRAGKPTIICPFIADQPYWGQRVLELGAGTKPIPQKHLTVDALAGAIHTAVTDRTMQARAAALGEQIRAEDGVGTAVGIIERTMRRKTG